jgi:type I restriction enzyme S subunit
LQVRLPPLPEQRRIAAILDQADVLRGKRREVLARLDEMAHAIFVEMFGDPIENPRRFASTRLGTLVEELRGISYGIVQRGPDQDDGVAVLRISDIAGGKVNSTKLKRTTPEIAGRFRRTSLVGGELVISIRGTVGLVAIVPDSLAGANVSREIAVIPLMRDVSRTFVRDLIRTDGAQQHIVADVKGVAQSGINLEDLRELPIIQPPAHEVAEYERRIAAYERLDMRAAMSMADFDALFASLRHRAFNGEL